jgi:hypothetical protein
MWCPPGLLGKVTVFTFEMRRLTCRLGNSLLVLKLSPSNFTTWISFLLLPLANYQKLGGLRQVKFILLQCRRPESEIKLCPGLGPPEAPTSGGDLQF